MVSVYNLIHQFFFFFVLKYIRLMFSPIFFILFPWLFHVLDFRSHFLPTVYYVSLRHSCRRGSSAAPVCPSVVFLSRAIDSLPLAADPSCDTLCFFLYLPPSPSRLLPSPSPRRGVALTFVLSLVFNLPSPPHNTPPPHAVSFALSLCPS